MNVVNRFTEDRAQGKKRIVERAVASGRFVEVTTYFDLPPDGAPKRATLVFRKPEHAARIAAVLSAITED